MGSQNKCDSHQECPYPHHADAGHPQSLERNMWIEGSSNSLLFSVYCAGCSLFILCVGLSHVYLMLLWLPWEDIHTWLTQERPFTLPVDLLTCCNISRKKAQLWSEISSAFFATAVVTPYMFPQPVKNIASAPHLRDLFHWRVCSSFTCPRVLNTSEEGEAWVSCGTILRGHLGQWTTCSGVGRELAMGHCLKIRAREDDLLPLMLSFTTMSPTLPCSKWEGERFLFSAREEPAQITLFYSKHVQLWLQWSSCCTGSSQESLPGDNLFIHSGLQLSVSWRWRSKLLNVVSVTFPSS